MAFKRKSILGYGMKLFRKLRENSYINGFFRKVLKGSNEFQKNIYSFLINRWPPSGEVNCVFGSCNFKMYTKCDDGLVQFFYYNLPYHEKADLNLFVELSRQANIILDIGANTGLFSILAGKVNPDAQIFAIEPYSVNSQRMKRNLHLNCLNNVKVCEIAMGEFESEMNLSVPKNNSITDVSSFNDNFSRSIYPEILWDTQSVIVCSLDKFANENNIKIDLIKCDVESFEMEVFSGADRILREHRPVVLFECFLDEERKLFFNNLLIKYNYFVCLILEEGVVYTNEGFVNTPYALNYLITPNKPLKTFHSYKNVGDLWAEVKNIF